MRFYVPLVLLSLGLLSNACKKTTSVASEYIAKKESADAEPRDDGMCLNGLGLCSIEPDPEPEPEPDPDTCLTGLGLCSPAEPEPDDPTGGGEGGGGTGTGTGTEKDPLPAPKEDVALIEKGTKILNTCAGCHNGAVAKTELNKALVPKLDNALSKQADMHGTVKQHFEGQDRKALEASLKTL